MRLFTLGIILPFAIIGCTTIQSEQTGSVSSERKAAAAGDDDLALDVTRGLTFAEAHCAACHGVKDRQTSPNLQAPPFHAIANTNGLTKDTLTVWLGDSHNYPDLMDFDIEHADIDALATYILTLQRADYKPSIQ
ncbi:c-type cytochrome [Parasphingorhabdus sp.]|uniref:c-type cytochrome n=1 Tax=Parasphingorhabdus sp. TaxID=2709688 RepID=UPI003BAFCA09